MSNQQPPASARQRLDKWLFFTRMLKSRSLAQKAIEGGDARVNDRPIRQPSHLLHAGDIVTLSMGERPVVLKVLLPGAKRGPFEEARLLYDDLTPPPPSREDKAIVEQAVRERGAGRPTKRERRQTDRLLDWPED